MAAKSAKNIVTIKITKEDLFKSKKSGMPQIGIRVSCPEQVIDGHRYPARSEMYFLAPFRNYKFQVSGSPTGNGDYGSGQVVNLHNIISVFSATTTPQFSNVAWGDKNEKGNIIHEVMKGLANNALMQFINITFRGYDGYKLDIESYTANDLDDMFGTGDGIPYIPIMDAVEVFVFASIIYLRKYYEYHNIPEYQLKWLDSLKEI